MWNNRMKEYAAAMVPAYLKCAAWSSTYEDENGEVYEGLETFEFSDEAKEEAEIICRFFVNDAWGFLDHFTAKEAGFSLWLSHNGHGAGFFDYSCGQDTRRHADILQEKASAIREKNIYVDGGRLFFDLC